MNAPMHAALRQYAMVGMETGVAAATPHQLILMLFDGALLSLANARRHLAGGAVADKGMAIGKALAIIDGGLKASLDLEAGGEIARNLYALYEYIEQRLVEANLRNDADLIAEAMRLLRELQGAWQEIGERTVATV